MEASKIAKSTKGSNSCPLLLLHESTGIQYKFLITTNYQTVAVLAKYCG